MRVIITRHVGIIGIISRDLKNYGLSNRPKCHISRYKWRLDSWFSTRESGRDLVGIKANLFNINRIWLLWHSKRPSDRKGLQLPGAIRPTSCWPNAEQGHNGRWEWRVFLCLQVSYIKMAIVGVRHFMPGNCGWDINVRVVTGEADARSFPS
jgi:hypothetical protein